MYLTEDIKGFAGKESERSFYGKKGEKVKEISDHGNVLIVELNGQRFGVNKQKLSQEKIK